jgi:hypothetical protein
VIYHCFKASGELLWKLSEITVHWWKLSPIIWIVKPGNNLRQLAANYQIWFFLMAKTRYRITENAGIRKKSSVLASSPLRIWAPEYKTYSVFYQKA